MFFFISGFAQIKSASLTASGLTCSMCSRAIYKALEKVSSVEHIDVNIEKSSYNIQFKNNEKIVLDDIKNAVTGAGFSVASLQVTAAFNNTPVFNDAHIDIGGCTYHFLNITSQTLNGDKTMTILDKNYLPTNEHKKYAQYTKMKCFQTGYMENCCPNDKHNKTRVYHVTL